LQRTSPSPWPILRIARAGEAIHEALEPARDVLRQRLAAPRDRAMPLTAHATARVEPRVSVGSAKPLAHLQPNPIFCLTMQHRVGDEYHRRVGLASEQKEPKAVPTEPTKTVKLPGADHPITIETNPARVVVSVAGRVIADTREALILREASYPPVQYIPRRDVDISLLKRTDHSTYCPYKGECSYYSIPIGGERSANAVWTYEAPFSAVAQIKDHLAFYPDRVDAVKARPAS
jgi:uncharacterized protein (DUF427 family)